MERNIFRTREGLTEFNFRQIAAVTKCDNGLVDVHLCSGTIFTVHKCDAKKFLHWYHYCKDTLDFELDELRHNLGMSV